MVCVQFVVFGASKTFHHQQKYQAKVVEDKYDCMVQQNMQNQTSQT